MCLQFYLKKLLHSCFMYFSTIEILRKNVKYVNTSSTSFRGFYCRLWGNKCRLVFLKPKPFGFILVQRRIQGPVKNL